jgi:hypothetical protein
VDRAARRGLLGLALAATLGALLAGTHATPAHADADPPSDILLVQNAFYPYNYAPMSSTALEQVLREAHAAGFQLKVAIVDTPTDLGALPQLFGKPQTYADFLDREISFNTKVPVLTVMPNGFGTAGGAPAVLALRGLRPDARHNAAGLVVSAILAVERLSAATGHPIAAPPLPSVTAGGHSGGGVSPALTFGAPVALVVLIAGAFAMMRLVRRIDTDAEEDDLTQDDDLRVKDDLDDDET